MRPALRLIFATAALSGSFFVAQSAHAEALDACGDIFFGGSGSIDCEVVADPGECKLNCTPVSFQAECAASLKVDCDASCPKVPEVSCTGSCQGTCETECNGGNFDCNAYCEGNCTGDCSSQCSAADDKAECQASCKATCQADCSANCEGNPPDCTGQCQGCCTGECTASSELECQIDCQASGYANCQASLQGGCEGSCDAPSGGLFCNGQWIDTSNVDSCVAAIEAAFNIEVTYSAEGECTGNTCTGSAEASASCSAAPEQSSAGIGFGALALGFAAAGMTAARRIRRNKK